MSDASAPTTSEPRPPLVRVRMLETVEPTITDRTCYHFDTVWSVSEDRALEWSAEGKAEILPTTEAPTPVVEEPEPVFGEEN